LATAATTAAVIAAQHTSSYRVKFRRREFLELVDIAKPQIIYHRNRMHFFAYDGFVMYTFECDSRDFSQRVIEAIEFSNYRWSE
jgi:predicted ATP-grasp superfamily ATP-dependent carboligase